MKIKYNRIFKDWESFKTSQVQNTKYLIKGILPPTPYILQGVVFVVILTIFTLQFFLFFSTDIVYLLYI